MAEFQPTSVRELMQYQQGQRQALEARGQDMRIAQMLSRALDPAMPKGFRQLGLKAVSQSLGIDARGDRAKELIGVLSGLDPQSLEGIRRGVVNSVGSAQPGEIHQMARGVLSGQVPPDQLMQLAAASQQIGEQPEQQSQPAERMRLGGPSPLGEAPQAPMKVGAGDSPYVAQERVPFSAGEGTGVPKYKEGDTPPRMREIAPELAGVLGLNQSERYRNIDVIRGGYNRIPTDYEGQQKLANDIRTMQDGVVNTMTMASQLSKLVGNRPEVLGTTTERGLISTIGNVNISSVIEQTREAIRGLGIFVPEWGRASGDEKSIYDTAVGKAVKDAAGKLVDTIGPSDPSIRYNITEAAQTNARIRSLLIPLAFAMASAKGQSGRFLSDRDVALQLEEIGNSRDPKQFQAALKDMTARIHDGYNNRMKAQVGSEIPINPSITPDAAKMMAGSRVVPDSVAQHVASMRSSDVPTPDTDAEGVGRFARPQIAPNARPPQPESTPPSTRSLPRSGPTIEEEEGAKSKLAQEDRQAVLEARQQNRRRLELAEEQEARASRQEVEHRRERIQSAFEAASRRLAGGLQGASVSASVPASGGDQDQAAFRINPAPQRQPPAPVSAAPYQPQPRRR